MSKKVNEEKKIVIETNNSYLKNQLKVLQQFEGVTVEAHEKAFNYILKTMNEMIEQNRDQAAKIISLQNEVATLTDRVYHFMGELKKAEAKKNVETKVKVAKKTVKKATK